MGIYFLFTLSVFVIQGVLGVDGEKILREGDSLTLNTNVTKQERDTILWYFNDTLIALINGDANKSCLFDGERGRFRDRLEVDYESGSLNITNITAEHTGQYEAKIIRRESTGTRQILNRNSKCDRTRVIPKSSTTAKTINKFFVSVSVSLSGPGKPFEDLEGEKEHERNSLIAGGCATVLILIAAAVVGVICSLRGRMANDREKKKLKHPLKGGGKTLFYFKLKFASQNMQSLLQISWARLSSDSHESPSSSSGSYEYEVNRSSHFMYFSDGKAIGS